MGEHSAIIYEKDNPNDDPFEPMGYHCHKCGEWYREEEMQRVDRARDTVYFCVDCNKEVNHEHD